jgi:hypothetical protein
VKEFSPRNIIDKGKTPHSAGMEPVKWFRVKSSDFRFWRDVSEVGISRERELEEKDNSWRFVKRPREEGTDPNNEEDLKIFKLVRVVSEINISEGRVPFNP